MPPRANIPSPLAPALASVAPLRVAAVGLASWDHFIVVDRYPAVGSYQIVREEASLPGGTTMNTAVALARLGTQVAIAAFVGDDDHGTELRAVLQGEGVDTTWLATRPGERTDVSTVIVSREPPERTIYWHRGAHLVRGDRLDIAALFDHDVVVIDVADASLRRFLVDLPAHTQPKARLLGTLSYLVDSEEPDELDVALRYDVIVGNEREFLALTGVHDADGAVAAIQQAMTSANLRAAVMSCGAAGCRVWSATEHWDIAAFEVEVVDTTGAGDAFAAGVAYGMARRWDWPRLGRFANAVGALALRALGSQTALPVMSEVASLIGEDPTKLNE